MILADTTIAIQWLRRPSPKTLGIIRGHNAAICGATIAEVYAGARAEADFSRYDLALGVFQLVVDPTDVWRKAGRNISKLGSKGLIVPFHDAMIATIAIDLGVELWQDDKHFPMIQGVLPDLKLFQPPA